MIVILYVIKEKFSEITIVVGIRVRKVEMDFTIEIGNNEIYRNSFSMFSK